MTHFLLTCLLGVINRMIYIGDNRLFSGKNAVEEILIKALDGLKKSNFINKMNSDQRTIDNSISDLACLELFHLFSKTDYNFGAYFSLCEWMALNNYYFDSEKNGGEKFKFKEKYIEQEDNRREIYISFKKLIECNPQVKNLFFEEQMIFPQDDKDVYVELVAFNEFFKNSFEVFLQDTIEIRSLVKYTSHRDKFRKKIIDAWNIKYCPYCNMLPLVDYDNNKKSTAELDHFLSQADFPLFGLSYGNFIVACSICNQKFKSAKYSRILNVRQHGFDSDVLFTHANISYNSYYKPEINEVEIKIENNCSDPEKCEQIENSITNFQLKACYEENSEAKKAVCNIYRHINTMYDSFYLGKTGEYSNLEMADIYKLLIDFIIENQLLLDRNYPPSSDIINIHFGKLNNDTLTDILKGSVSSLS